MAIHNLNSITTNAGDALVVVDPASTVLVRDSISVVTDGAGNDGIVVSATAAGTIIGMDGYIATDEGFGIDILARDVQVKVGPSGLMVTSSDAIRANSAAINTTIVNQGNIQSAGSAVAFIGLDPQQMSIVNSGSMTSMGTAILMRSGGSVDNSGSIQGKSVAILSSATLDPLHLQNSGLITSQSNAITANGPGSEVLNSGEIRSTSVAVNLTAAEAHVVNEGLISSAKEAAVSTVEGLDLHNSGTITGQTLGVAATSDDRKNNGIGEHRLTNTGTIEARAGNAVRLQGSDTLVINEEGAMISSSGIALSLSGDDTRVVNRGTLASQGNALNMTDGSGALDNGGHIVSDREGVLMGGNGTVSNSGTIDAERAAIHFSNGTGTAVFARVTNTGVMASALAQTILTSTSTFHIVNAGEMRSHQTAIEVGNGAGTVSNSGLIDSELGGVRQDGVAAPMTMVNTGTIRAITEAVHVVEGSRVSNGGLLVGERGVTFADLGASRFSTLVNSGKIEGQVRLAGSAGGAHIGNTGMIEFDGTAVALLNTGGLARLANGGTVIGGTLAGTFAIECSAQVQEVTNAGLILGNIALGDGNDLYSGGNGHLVGEILGGAGNDRLLMGVDDDTVQGNAGNDLILGRAGNDVMFGGDGQDTMTGDDGSDDMNGGAGNDLMTGGLGEDTLSGGDGNDTLVGNDGNDSLIGARNDDVLMGGDGDDFADGGFENDTIVGGRGDDTLLGNRGNDLVTGGDGADSILGGDANDTLSGGAGRDTIDGEGGNDLVVGGLDDDSLSGGDGADTLVGNEGNDTLLGGSGLDRLSGGLGDDELTGGTLADVFVFIVKGGDDVITDFENNVDLIDLTAFNTTFGAMQTAISNFNGGSLIDLDAMGGEGSIWVQGLPAGFLNNNDFIF